MGTSQSSKGSPSNTPFIPNWVLDPEPKENPQSDHSNGKDKATEDDRKKPLEKPTELIPKAPSGRFRGTRLSMGKYAQTGSSSEMKKGVGRYIQKGLGGTKTAVRRFAGTARVADSLFKNLAAVSSGKTPSPESPLDPKNLSGKTVHEIMDAVVEAVQPIDGTLDGESSRSAIRDALSELLSKFKDADILNLKEEERDFVIQQYIALDVFAHFQLDVGKVLQDKAPSTKTALSRLKEVKNYIKETIAASFRKLFAAGQKISAGRVKQFVSDALKDSFDVFQEYLR